VINIASQAANLKPTATVVRKENGDVEVERGDLMSDPEKRKAIAASKQAEEARDEK